MKKLIISVISTVMIGAGVAFKSNHDVSVSTVEKSSKETTSVEKKKFKVSKHEDIDKEESKTNERFDLRLDKYISKVIVENSAGTSTKSYEDTKLAKVEINSKKLINSLVLIEYSIKITNEGELDGYIGDIVDYIPKDLKFNSEMNKDWFISTDGEIPSLLKIQKLAWRGGRRL